jgi:NAD-dependent DNA ligase
MGKGLKDIKKILDDPTGYAQSVKTVKRLVTILTKMSDHYYSDTEALVDDDTYDLMLEVLKKRDPNNPFLFETGTTVKDETDIQLPYGMPSLNKIKPGEKSLELWFKKYPGKYIISDKLDGVSVQIFKDENGEVDIFTKKRMDIGTSKKHILQYLLDTDVLDAVPNNTSIRGEIVISKKNFEKFSDRYKNTRNIIGIINSKKMDTRVLKKLEIVAYGILSPTMKMSQQIKKLKQWGFTTVWNREFDLKKLYKGKYDKDPDVKYIKDDEIDDDTNIGKITKKLMGILRYRRTESPYDCDGIVIMDDSKAYTHINDRNPPYAMAFKFNIKSDMKEVEVVKVNWDISMYGVMKPVVQIKPVDIRGVTITNVTAHNASNVFDNKIGKKTILKISRSGDVIPKIEEVIKSTKADMPKIKWKWNDTEVDIIATKPTGTLYDTMMIKRILHFFKTLNVKYLSDGLMTILYNNGYDSVVAVLKASHEKDTEPYDFDGLGEKMMTKIYTQIDKAMKNHNKNFIPKLMAGSLAMGQGIGERKLKDLVRSIPDILNDDVYKNKKKLKERILDTDGFSDITADKIINGIVPFVKFIKAVQKYYPFDYKVDTKAKKKKNTKNTKGKSTKNTKNTKGKSKYDVTKVILTGFRDGDGTIGDYLDDNDGKLVTSVSKKTTLIVADDINSTSSKVTKGKSLGIPVISKEEFMKYIS